MMRRMGTRIRTTILTLSLLAGAAHADGVCVEADAQRDMLVGDDRVAAVQTLQAAIAASGKPVGPPCTETWEVSHTRLGSSLQILITTPSGAVTGSAATLEQLPSAYENMLQRLSPPPLATPAETPPVAPPQPYTVAPPTSSTERGSIYLRIGYAIAPATDSQIETRNGPTFAVGYRRLIAENLLLDVALFETHVWREPISTDYGANLLSFVRIGAYYHRPTSASSALYVGGGVSFGQMAMAYINGPDQTQPPYPGDEHGYALQLEPAVGYETFRERSTRLFFQLAVVLPLDTIVRETYAPLTTTYYVPTVALSVGLSFQP